MYFVGRAVQDLADGALLTLAILASVIEYNHLAIYLALELVEVVINVLVHSRQALLKQPLPLLDLVLGLALENEFVVAQSLPRLVGLSVLEQLGAVELEVLERGHECFHSLLYLVHKLVLLVHSVAFVRAKERTRLTNTDLAVNAIQLPWLVVFQADLVRLQLGRAKIAVAGMHLVVSVVEQLVAGARLNDEGIVAVVPLDVVGFVEAASASQGALELVLASLGEEAFEGNGLHVFVGAFFVFARKCEAVSWRANGLLLATEMAGLD